MGITDCECMFVALVIQHEMGMRHIFMWPDNIFPHYLIHGTIFEKKKLLKSKCVF
jgi:hypothetical protein